MLPQAYTERMQMLLGEDFALYQKSLEEAPSRALHVNLYKITGERLQELLGDGVTPLSYADDGYRILTDLPLGKHPLHFAGAYYIQDPSAMVPVASAEVTQGMWVLDVCASPGGKSTQLANRIGRDGLLVSNEIVPSRCQILSGNGERMGLTNQVVTNTDAATLGTLYPETFDLVLVDAPCSGEGMFRKYPDAVSEWSLGNVTACATRQLEILEDAIQCLKPGGELIYSTCTFSTEENEEVVATFLHRHPDFTLLPVGEAICQVTAPAIHLTTIGEPLATQIRECARRFYPHHAYGEGQFVARLRKGEGEPSFKKKKPQDDRKPLNQEERRIWDAFVKDTFLSGTTLPTPVMWKGRVCLLNHDLPASKVATYSYGVFAGEIVKGRFVPSHWLVNAYGCAFKRKLNYPADAKELVTYLTGNTYPTDAPDGWTAILVEGCPLGLGKVSGGVVKNHFPKGLRPHLS